jgi:uncharacterized membrane protein HdeD (DUF308 family)
MSTPMPDQLKAFRSLWWLFVVFGVLTLAAGVILIVWPGPSLTTIAVIIGIFLLIDGVIDVIASIFGKGEGRGVVAMLGVLSLIAGVILVKHPFNALAVLVIIVGIWFVVSGVARFVAAFSDADSRGTNIAVGILDIVAGIVVLAWPELSLKTLAVLAGIVFVIRGIAFIYGGLQVRKLPQDPDGTGLAPAIA